MYDIDLKNVKKGKRFYGTFLFIGILFSLILTGVIILVSITNSKLDAEVMSSEVNIINDDDMYKKSYKYSVDGKEYTCVSSSSTSWIPKTENSIIYYESANPINCSTSSNFRTTLIIAIFYIVPAIFIIIAIINMKKVNKRVALINELNKNGKLVKGLTYHMEPTGMVVNNVTIMKPVVDYTLPSGSVIQLVGDPRHDRKDCDEDGLMDIIIDENNPDNYFIDFEINRISGNLPSDYYKKPMEQQSNIDVVEEDIEDNNDASLQTISYKELQNDKNQ